MTRFVLMVLLLGLYVLAPSISAQEQAAAVPFTEVETAICSEVMEREPVGTAESFGSDVGQVYLWTKLIGATDTTIVRHVWYYNGNEIANVELPVRSSMWRTWSSKKILPTWIGDWEVKVMDAQGNILKSVGFKIEKPAMPAEETPVETPAEPAVETPAEPAVEPPADST